jgi:putative tricarboxylic transport membrane protein
MKTPAWEENLKRYDWTPFVKTGGDLDQFLASEERRVHDVVGQLGISG